MEPEAFHQGKFMPLADANVGIMTHALHYGTSVFEGIRGNWNPDDQKIHIFRAKDHYARFLKGCHVMMIKIPYTEDELVQLTIEMVERSGYREDIYIRPLGFKGAEKVADLRLQNLEDSFALFPIPFGQYLDVNTAISCCVASWRRIDDTMIPPRVKIGGHYVNSVLAKTDATLAGFDEAIFLTMDGHVCEGTGENIFLVVGDKLITPATSDNALPGITRDTIMKLGRDELGIETMERSVDRTELYLADEVFLTGTAAHLTPVGQIDKRAIGNGEIGSVTKALQDLYFDVIQGKNDKYLNWCTSVTPSI